jgi:chemotaxis protein methyltransferase CheR
VNVLSSPHPLLADPGYLRLKAYLIGSTGLAYYEDKDDDLARRIAPLLARAGAPDCGSYLALLESSPAGQAELDALVANLTIGETFFFRHRELFDALGDIVLPDLLARNQHSRQLRIWSAGCSIGAEPYTLAILCKRDWAPRLAGWDVSILGTDINRHFLARAREGLFEEWALRNTPVEVKQDCFTRDGSAWRLKPEYRSGVSFQYHNLVTDISPSLVNNLFAFDLILCRNVTIYFSSDIVRRIIDHFYQSLVEGGWLLVGHAEPNLEVYQAFHTVNAPGAILYQKRKDRPERMLLSSSSPVEELPPPARQADAPCWSPPQLSAEPVSRMVNRPPPLPPRPATSSTVEEIRALADRGDWGDANRACQQALQEDRLNPVIHFYHALVLEQMGRHTETEKALRRVIYLDRQFILAHYYLGLFLQKQGELPQAARAFRNVLQLLSRVSPLQVFSDGDGITAGELEKLTQRHLEALEGGPTRDSEP